MDAATTSPDADQAQPTSTFDTFTHLSMLLNQEVELHNVTKSMLVQSQAMSQVWERACLVAQSDLYHAQFKLSAAETRIEQLTAENQRLSTTLDHLIPARLDHVHTTRGANPVDNSSSQNEKVVGKPYNGSAGESRV